MADEPSNAIIAHGTKYEVEATLGGGDFFEIGEITNVTPPNEQADDIEVTHMQSPGRYKEFRQGLIDPGNAVFKLNNIPGDATDDFCAAWKTSGEARATRITFPNAKTRTFPAYVKSFVQDAMDPSKTITGTITVKVAGQIIRG